MQRRGACSGDENLGSQASLPAHLLAPSQPISRPRNSESWAPSGWQSWGLHPALLGPKLWAFDLPMRHCLLQKGHWQGKSWGNSIFLCSLRMRPVAQLLLFTFVEMHRTLPAAESRLTTQYRAGAGLHLICMWFAYAS